MIAELDIALLKDLGGWTAFLVVVIWGGRSFMTLARDFSNSVVLELKEIKLAIRGQERIVGELIAKVDSQGEQLDRLERG